MESPTGCNHIPVDRSAEDTPGQQRCLRRRSGLAVTVLALLLPLGFLECVSRVFLPRVPCSAQVERNPFRYSGWPEYITDYREQCETGTRHCVILSNCQGYGGEYRSRMIYAVELEKKLNAQAAGNAARWEVHNWSVDGATSLDYLWMAAYLVTSPPDVVIALTGFADYRAEHYRESLQYSRTDLGRLIVHPRIVAALPSGFLQRHASVESVLHFASLDLLALRRFRLFGWSWSDRRLPGIYNACFAPNMTYLPWQLPGRPLIPAIRRPDGAGEATLGLTYDERSTRMLAEYLETLSNIPGAVRIVAAQPYQHSDCTEEQRLSADAETFCARYGLHYWDLRNALPLNEFVSTAHFARANHVAMAQLLADRLLPLLPTED